MIKKLPRPEPSSLTAKIETVERSYFISADAEQQSPVSDEATIDIVGRIEWISPDLKQHLGEEIGISVVCARTFERDGRTPPSDKPFLLTVNLRQGGSSMMAYLPADAFWALPQLIASSAITHVQARFEPPYYGSGALLSLHFASASRIDG